MGFWKDQQEQGWSHTDKFACTSCVNEEALEQILRASEDPDRACTFCGRAPAAPLDALVEAFVGGLYHEYENALDGVGWDGREGGFQWPDTWDTWDLIGDFGDVLVGDGLIDAVRHAVHDQTWVERNFAERRRDDVLTESWERFCEAVQYKTRYVFWRARHADDDDVQYAGEVPAAKILDEVGSLVESLGLVLTLPSGTQFWRAQTHMELEIPPTAARLGTAPRALALRSNRMNPAGIPMFYGADSAETATSEVALHSEDDRVTCCTFETSADAMALDYTALPAVPSMFDPVLGRLRRALIFLHRFVEQLSDRVPAAQEQIDYVPTQVVTEYFLRVHREDRPIVGLLYASSLTGSVCTVLDVSNQACVEQEPGWDEGDELRLGLIPTSISTRLLSDEDKCN